MKKLLSSILTKLNGLARLRFGLRSSVFVFMLLLGLSAHAAEKALPADAHDFYVSYAGIVNWAVSDKYANVPCTDNDNCPHEMIYAKKLWVDVRFTSKDDTYTAKTGSGSNFDFEPYDYRGSQVSYVFTIPQDEITAIENKTLDPKSLVTISVRDGVTNIPDPHYTAKCRYDNDNNQKIDPNCQEDDPQVIVPAKILTIHVKGV